MDIQESCTMATEFVMLLLIVSAIGVMVTTFFGWKACEVRLLRMRTEELTQQIEMTRDKE